MRKRACRSSDSVNSEYTTTAEHGQALDKAAAESVALDEFLEQ
jgi:hypothetical protein